MVYLWSKDLETGDQRIDNQHKQLIEAINNLLAACNSGKGRVELEKTIQFLVDYVDKHFADEEALQRQYRYPDYVSHKKRHDAFKVVVRDFAAALKKDGPNIALVGKVNSDIGGWLVSHIKKEDTKIALHIRKNA